MFFGEPIFFSNHCETPLGAFILTPRMRVARQNSIEPIIINDAVYDGCGVTRHDKSPTVNCWMIQWFKWFATAAFRQAFATQLDAQLSRVYFFAASNLETGFCWNEFNETQTYNCIIWGNYCNYFVRFSDSIFVMRLEKKAEEFKLLGTESNFTQNFLILTF